MVKVTIPMVCYCLPICCACEEEFQPVPTPNNCPEPPSEVLCPECGVVRSTEYYRAKNYCWLYYCIPFPCGKSRIFLGCKYCKHNLSRESITYCKECNVGYTFHTQHCPTCGETINY